jgi:hypothetical protein
VAQREQTGAIVDSVLHEYLKRQLAKWGVAFEALDSGPS